VLKPLTGRAFLAYGDVVFEVRQLGDALWGGGIDGFQAVHQCLVAEMSRRRSLSVARDRALKQRSGQRCTAEPCGQDPRG
jgi:hypothetical protein